VTGDSPEARAAAQRFDELLKAFGFPEPGRHEGDARIVARRPAAQRVRHLAHPSISRWRMPQRHLFEPIVVPGSD
jgi:hypothetical protein